MNDALPSLVVMLFGVFVVGVATRRLGRFERQVTFVSLALHYVASLAQVVITRDVYGGGDLMAYHRTGTNLAELLRRDFGTFAPEMIKLFTQERARLPVGLQESSTGTMFSVSGWLHWVLADSLYAVCLVVGVIALLSTILIYHVFRDGLHASYRPRVICACLLVPSVVFWTSGLLKEALAMPGLALFFWGLYRLMSRRVSVRPIAATALGFYLLSLVKAYLMFPIALAFGIYFYVTRAQRAGKRSSWLTKPAYFVGGIALSLLGVTLLGQLFPTYSVAQFAEEAAALQQIGARISGGSSFQYSATLTTSFAGQMLLSPLALATTLARPLIFEAGNPLMLVSALEIGALVFIALRGLWTRGLRTCIIQIMTTPLLAYCLVVVVIAGVGIGLASTNLGTLARYRAPIMPFYATLVMVVGLRPPRGAPKRP